ncbi:MAG: hypothetical protein U0802_00970 [Candidatus Binatia bacterium]
MGSPTIAVLDPSALGPADRLVVPARLPTAAGRVLGLRVDRAWPSFQRVAQCFATLARARRQVRDVVFFDPDVRIGTTEEERRKVRGSPAASTWRSSGSGPEARVRRGVSTTRSKCCGRESRPRWS